MNERKTPIHPFKGINYEFANKMWELTSSDIDNLTTIVYWTFKSTENPETKYFFIKNWLFTSNYREKIDGKLCYGGKFSYVEEVDTKDPIEHRQDGTLTSESWLKIFELKKSLKSASIEEFI